MNFMKNTLFERLLEYFHIDETTYKELTAPVSIDSFASGHEFKDMDIAVSIVKEAVKNKDKIFIYGDYDADGIMSTSIVTKALLYLGLVPQFYIPNRYKDGYGITIEKAEKIVELGVKLVITVDNGISAFDAISYLKEHDVKVVVLDHHTVQDKVPNADVIIHPTYSEFGITASSAGFVSFMFSWALLGRFDKYLASLAAISLISDMMPLKDYNRKFLRLMISEYQDGEFYPIDLLKEDSPFDENSIGLKIAPKINALGRLLEDNSINNIVRFFVTNDKDKVRSLNKWIIETNEARKIESKSAEENVPDYDNKQAAIVLLSDVKEGIIGLLANHLCSKEHKPTIVFTEETNEGILKGSCRAPEGFNVVDAFNACGDIVITFGGHALAGGCSIYKKDLEEFTKRFTKFAEDTPIVEPKREEVEIGLTEITDENYELIQSFAPFGEGWKAPTFLVKHVKTDSLTFSKSGEHILTYIGTNLKLTGFGFSKEVVREYSYVDLLGKIKESFYRGNRSLEFNIRKVRESK